MKTTSLTTTPAVRFGATHGYRFIGDSVELNATFAIASRTAYDRAWALQLWACPSVPARTDELIGHLVAEATLPPIVEIAGENEPYVVTAAAQPPAGDRDHSMVLVLVANRGGTSAFDEVHDVASFPALERFVLPRMVGPITHRIEGGSVHVEVAAIENPRDLGNVSGTLSLELWALSAPYSGGNFAGSPLAGAILGSLAGQDRWIQLGLELNYSAPTAGETQLVVMLREWTGAGYTTRDFANLGTLPVAAPVPPPAQPVAAPAPAPVAKSAAAEPQVSAVTPPTPKPTIATTKPAKAPVAGKVSLNSATLDQLLAVKGLPKAVAERIIRDRPFAAVDDVKKVKGMGEKLLSKIRSQLAL